MSTTVVEFTADQFKFLFKTLYEVDKELEYLCDEDEHDGDDDMLEKRPENLKKMIMVISIMITLLRENWADYGSK